MHTETQLTKIRTDESLRETCIHGTQAFPFHYTFEYYASKPMQYLFSAWHWHTEVEFFYLQSGSVTYSAGDTELHLKAGDCAFVNSRVLHRGVTNGCVYHTAVFSQNVLGMPQSLIY